MAFKILTGSCEYYYDTLLTGGPVNIYSYDAKGNVSDIINGDTGVIAAHYEYSPFGETVVQAGDAQVLALNPYAFSTKYLDRETTLYYYGHRFYNPLLGRWQKRDPIGEMGGLNLYGFVGNNPLLRIDYFGTAWWEWIPIASTAIHGWNKYFESVPGLKVQDYKSFETGNFSEEGITECEKAIAAKVGEFQASFIGVASGPDAMKILMSGASGLVGLWAIKTGAKGAVGGTVTAGALTADAIIDLAVVLDTVFDIGNAGKEAQQKYCHCKPR
jgi:RHS repeat-associated protein